VRAGEEKMRELISGQTIRMDAHAAGSEPKFENLHIHKEPNNHKGGADIRIHVDSDHTVCDSPKNDHQKKIISEVKRVLKKNPDKTKKFVKEILDEIKRFSDSDPDSEFKKKEPDEQRKILIDFAERIGDYFGCKKIKDIMAVEIDNRISFLLTSHKPEKGKLFFIRQDISRRYIKVGDDLEQIFYGNNKYCCKLDVLASAKTTLPRFEKIAKDVMPTSKIKLGELKPRNYVHILRNGLIIGCFKCYDGDIVFECHNSYKEKKKIIPLSDLTDGDIKDIILNTKGSPPRK
jgi:hypothetical protein